MNKRLRQVRLTHLRRVVEAAPDDRFHMTSFMDAQASCGTAYCAYGWATQDTWFKKRGCKLLQIGPSGKIYWPHIDGIGASNSEILLSTFFNISREEADHIFHLDADSRDKPHSISKAMVLRNIDLALANQPTINYRHMEGYRK